MGDDDWLAQRFEQHRGHLRAVALRMLGSVAEAEDAVQECWLRLSRSDTSGVDNLGGWLTTVVSRISLDMLRRRAARREEPVADHRPDLSARPADRIDPEEQAVLADALGPALLVVLGTLAPAERLAFVLHDLFAVPFDEIGAILGRSPNAAKQLASRARHRVQGSAPGPVPDVSRQREIVDAFLAASRTGDFEALLVLLDPEVVLRADAAGVAMGASEARGADAVARVFCGRAMGAEPALVDGAVGVVWAPGGQPKVVWDLTVSRGRIVQIDMIAGAGSLQDMDLVVLPD